jgi:hypothetical protein
MSDTDPVEELGAEELRFMNARRESAITVGYAAAALAFVAKTDRTIRIIHTPSHGGGLTWRSLSPSSNAYLRQCRPEGVLR